MPTYDYRCTECGHQFELFHSMKDAPRKKCPKCAKNALERLIGGGGGIIFKGGGFYETDYRSDAYKKSAAADTAAPAPAKNADSSSCACGKKSASDCASGAPGAGGKPAKAAD